jgi:alkyl hydroperoxide reductase subunit AhpC
MLCMIELGELAARSEDFARRNTRIMVVSLESPDEVAPTQKRFPRLTAVAAKEGNLISAAGVLHPGAGHGGGDTAAPTTVIIDRAGNVRWLFRSDSFLARLSPDEVLTAMDRYLPAEKGKSGQ